MNMDPIIAALIFGAENGSGGGLPEGWQLRSGDFTIAADTDSVPPVTHDVGVNPNMFIMWTDTVFSGTGYHPRLWAYAGNTRLALVPEEGYDVSKFDEMSDSDREQYGFYIDTSAILERGRTNGSPAAYLIGAVCYDTTTKIELVVPTSTIGLYQAGSTYHWIAVWYNYTYTEELA